MAFHCVRTVGLSLKLGSLVLETPKCIKTNLGVLNQIRTKKHWNPKFKSLRGKKTIKVDLPDTEDINKKPEELSEEEIRSKMKQRGVFPVKPWMERPIFFSSTGGIFEPYVPPEGDGKVSPITKAGAKQALQFIEKKSKSMLAIRKIRKFEDEFEVEDFLKEASEIYINAHEAMVKQDEDLMIKYATEKAYGEMLHNMECKTIRWKMINEIERPRLVQARSTDIVSEDNVFSQLTVRFHTQQSLAVYDRFGRLMHGSEILAKDVLEYVVFEKHLSNKYGTWRIHGKIIPDWMPPKESGLQTFRMPQQSPPESLPEPPSPTKQIEQPKGDTPQLATA